MGKYLTTFLSELNPSNDLDRITKAPLKDYVSLRFINSTKSLLRGGTAGTLAGLVMGTIQGDNLVDSATTGFLAGSFVDIVQYNLRQIYYVLSKITKD